MSKNGKFVFMNKGEKVDSLKINLFKKMKTLIKNGKLVKNKNCAKKWLKNVNFMKKWLKNVKLVEK